MQAFSSRSEQGLLSGYVCRLLTMVASLAEAGLGAPASLVAVCGLRGNNAGPGLWRPGAEAHRLIRPAPRRSLCLLHWQATSLTAGPPGESAPNFRSHTRKVVPEEWLVGW